MIEELQVKVRWIRSVFILLTLLYPSVARAQAVSTSGNSGEIPSEALKFLNQVLERYAHASTYHIEALENHELSGPFRRSWDRVITTAISAPDNRYHFEVRAEEVWIVQVSDGNTEWLYQPELHQYMQRPVPSPGPGRLPSSKTRGAYQLKQAQDTRKRLIDMQKLFLSAAFLPNEDLGVNGKHMNCRVIKAPQKELPGLSPKIVSQVTFWIDEKEGVIRKIVEHSEGPLRTAHPEDQYVNERTVIFAVADLEIASVPNQLFTFTPPLNAALVRDFDSDPMMVQLHGLVGKPAPMVELGPGDGPTVALKSFSGKIVLLDFWATWCVPCVESLPSLEKLHQEAAPKGLVMISIDEDEDPKKAADLWAKRKEPWPNFHSNGEIGKQFPDHGIPYFVLIDGSGKVVFSDAGLDEDHLRAAIAKVSPAVASVSPATSP
jgi:thiol-disulfide isomerase/thioredoxin/outer membrane lipoprotein-sorting protein